ncbi:MAG: hypothetical protein ACOYB7_19120, partial [Mycobacterium sp.]
MQKGKEKNMFNALLKGKQKVRKTSCSIQNMHETYDPKTMETNQGGEPRVPQPGAVAREVIYENQHIPEKNSQDGSDRSRCTSGQGDATQDYNWTTQEVPVDSQDLDDNLRLYLSPTQNANPADSPPTTQAPPPMTEQELEMNWNSVGPQIQATIWGPKPSVKSDVFTIERTYTGDDDSAKYLVIRAAQDVTSRVMKLSDIYRIELHTDAQQLVQDQISSQRSTTSDAFSTPPPLWSRSTSQGPYSDLTDHFREMGIPLLPNGNVDEMLLNAMWHYGKNPGEMEDQFATRIGVTAYLETSNKKKTTSDIWNFVAFVLHDHLQEINKQWFDSYPRHKMPFEMWWTRLGQFITQDQWLNGQTVTLGMESQARLNQKTIEANQFIDNAPEELKSKIISIYGYWSHNLAKTHFMGLSHFVECDAEFCRLRNAFMQAPTRAPSSGSVSSDDFQQLESIWWTTYSQLYAPKNIEFGDMTRLLTPIQQSQRHIESVALDGNCFSKATMDPRCNITIEDFMNGGRLCAIYVPNYLHMPPLASEILTGVRELPEKEKFFLW